MLLPPLSDTPAPDPAGAISFDSILFECSPDCVKLLDPEGRVLAMNRNGLCSMEIDDFARIANKDWASMWPVESHALVGAAVGTAREGRTGRFAAFCPTAKGSPKWWDVIVTPIVGLDGRIGQLMSVSRDVTAGYHANEARKATERALQDSEERLRLAANAAKLGIWVWDIAADHVTWEGERLYDIFGVPRSAETINVRRFLDEIVHPDDAGECGRALTQTAETGARLHCEGRFYRLPDRELRWFEFTGLPYRSRDGKPLSIIGTASDITDRKQADEALKQAALRKDEFLAMLAHELRNPLAPIGAAAELLQLGRLDDERVRRTSQIIDRQVKHMTGLVDDLLDVSRVTRGLVELDKVALSVSQVVGDAVEQVMPLIQARRHRLRLESSGGMPTVSGDKKRLVQVVANLLGNAAKYTQEGGEIVVRTEVRGAEVLIEIADNGIGMAPALVARAFDLFTQAERSSDRSSGGLGLGLALVKSLVNLHGGTVIAASAGAGQGSRFALCLPRLCHESTAPGLPDAVAPAAAQAKSLRIMVVDDNVDAAEMLGLLLEASGHQVFVEHGSLRALHTAAAQAPDVLLLDIGLPEMDGNELAQRLRARPETAGAVLIAVTGYGQERDRAQTQASGFDHHLVKPVDTRALAAILATIGQA